MSDHVLENSEAAAANASTMAIHTIPMEFYGGKNPAPPEIPVTPAAQKPTTSVAAALPSTAQKSSTTAVGAARGIQPPPRKSFLVPGIVAGVVLVVGGFGVWWFAIRSKPVTVAVTVPPPPVVAVQPEPVVPVVEQPVASTTTATPIAITPPAPELLIPAHAFKDSTDGDNDGLTDIEEELWGTNGGMADSDNDTFPDTTEIVNLYNPAGVTPERLIDARLVTMYTNSEYQYSLYYPNTWIDQAVAEDKKEVLFTSITQEYFDVRVLPFPTDMPFAAWFAKTFPNESLSAYTPFVNKFKVSGLMSSDGLVAIITDGAHVYLLTYNGVAGRDEINYRQTFKMMVQSFKTASASTPIVAQDDVKFVTTTNSSL